MLDAVLDLPPGTIESESGVKQRYVAVSGESPSILVHKALRHALLDACMTSQDIDLVILAEYPGAKRRNACVTEIAKELGLRQGVPVMEVGTAGGNSTSLLLTAMALMRTFTGLKRIALIAVDQLTDSLEQKELRKASSLGDGAAVLLVGSDPQKPGRLVHLCMQTNLAAEGVHYLRAEGSLGQRVAFEDNKTVPEVMVPEPQSAIRVNLAHTLHPEFLESLVKVVDTHHVSKLLLVPHQGSRLSLNWVKANFKAHVPLEVVDIFERYGNQGVASSMFALVDAKEAGQLGSCSHVLLLSMSAGLTYGACLLDLHGLAI